MRATIAAALLALAALAAGCAAGPEESAQDARECPEGGSAYHEAGTEGQATGDAADACPEGVEDESVKQTVEQDATGEGASTSRT